MSLIGIKIDKSLKSDDLSLSRDNLTTSSNISNGFKSTLKSLPQRIPAFGLMLALMSVFFVSWQSVIVQMLTQLHSIEILVFRSSIQFVIFLVVALIEKNSLIGESGDRLILAIRAIMGTVSITTIYMAYRFMPIGDASTIHFSSPIFVVVFGYFILKEKLTIVQVITGIITLVGVVIVAKPEFIFGSESEIIHEHRIEGTILALIAAITGAFVQICLRRLKKTPVAVILVWFSLTIVISCLIILVIIDELVWPTGWDTWTLLFVNGMCSVGDQLFFTMAFKYENAGPVSVIRTFNIVLVFVWEILVLTVIIEWTSIVGSSIVFSCIVIIAVFKWKTDNPSQFEHFFSKIICKQTSIKTSIKTDPNKNSIDTFSQNIQ